MEKYLNNEENSQRLIVLQNMIDKGGFGPYTIQYLTELIRTMKLDMVITE